jgi:hypothetical protein
MAKDYATAMLSPYGGLDLVNDPHRLAAGSLSTATNIICHDDGSFERVNGYTDILTSDIGVSYALSIYEFERWSGEKDIIFVYNDTLYKLDNSGNTATALITGLSANKKMGYCAYNDYLYFGNKFDANRVLVPSFTHKIARTVVATADATALASVKTLANALKADYNTHRVSTTQHSSADATNVIAFTDLAGGDSQATTNTACNELKNDFNAHRSQSSVHPTNDSYHLVAAADASSEATSITLINQIKACYNQHIEDSQVTLMNIVAPVTKATTADSGAGSGPNGAYYYVYTYYDTINGVESAPSPVSTLLTVANKTITVSAMEISTNPNVTHKRLYRTVASGATYYRVATVTNVTTTYSDSITDASLGLVCGTVLAGVIPPCDKLLIYGDRGYFAGDISNVFRMYYSEQYYPWFYKPATNFMDYDIEISALAKVPNGVLTFEKNKFWLNAGGTPSSFARILVSPIVGCTSQEGFCYRGDAVLFVSKYGIFYTDGGAFDQHKNLLSYNINQDLLTKNIDDSSLLYDSLNERLYCIVASV